MKRRNKLGWLVYELFVVPLQCHANFSLICESFRRGICILFLLAVCCGLLHSVASELQMVLDLLSNIYKLQSNWYLRLAWISFANKIKRRRLIYHL